MDRYSSHLGTLIRMFKNYPVKKVLEFGCGEYSTGFFLAHGADVTSIEMQDPDWAMKVTQMFPHAKIKVAIGPDLWCTLNLEERYDLIFVDGHGESRPECVNWAFEHTDIVVAHDTQTDWYGWGRVKFDPEEWESWTNTTVVPWTTVFLRRTL